MVLGGSEAIESSIVFYFRHAAGPSVKLSQTMRSSSSSILIQSVSDCINSSQKSPNFFQQKPPCSHSYYIRKAFLESAAVRDMVNEIQLALEPDLHERD